MPRSKKLTLERSGNVSGSGAGWADAPDEAAACANTAAGAAIRRATVSHAVVMRMGVSSAKEGVAGRTVRSVDLAVAIDTAAADQPAAAFVELDPVIDGRWMLRADV